MELNAKQLANKKMANNFLDKEELIAKTRYATLSDLWQPKSKHSIHEEIGKKMQVQLDRLDRIKELRDLVIETLGK
jgi:hypothetical protein